MYTPQATHASLQDECRLRTSLPLGVLDKLIEAPAAANWLPVCAVHSEWWQVIARLECVWNICATTQRWKRIYLRRMLRRPVCWLQGWSY